MSSIRLHPKYGVNPSVGLCFWCGKDNGCIYLLGANRGEEAPHAAVCSYEPCDKCKAGMNLGITMIEVTLQAPREGQPPMGRNPDAWPTGRWCVLKEEVIREQLLPEARDRILSKRSAFVSAEDWKALGLPTEEKQLNE